MNRSVYFRLLSPQQYKARHSYRSIRLFLFLVFLASLAQSAIAQLTGTKTVPGDYPSLASAISALNAQGVGAGGVTINLIAGNPQTSPNGGYVIGGAGSPLLTTTSAANQVFLQGNGNTITAPTTLTSGALNDAIFKMIGADWITLDGFVLMENAVNTTTNAGTNNMIEWGIALLYATTINGVQNNTIKNNTIDLNRTYQNTFGIYSNSTHSAAAPMDTATATTSSGGNSSLDIYSNIITDVNNGIVVIGPMTAVDFNMDIDIGGTSPATANTLTNFGTTGTFSAFVHVPVAVCGIVVKNSIGINIARNSISSSNGGTVSGTLRGIFIPDFSLKPVGTFTNTISHNVVSVITGVAAAPLHGITVEDSTGTQTSTLHIDYNNFTNCGYNVSSPTGAATFVRDVMANLVTTISYNTFTNLTISSTGSVSLIAHNYPVPAGGSQTIQNNAIVTAFNKTAAGGTVICLSSIGSTIAADAVIQHINNNFSNITVTGTTNLKGFENSDGLSGTATTKTITGNIFNNWTGGSGATVSTWVMSYSYLGGATTISKNTITNITTQDTSFRGINIMPIGGNANPLTIDSNTISNVISSGNVYGIRCLNTSPVVNISNNTIHTLSSSAVSSRVFGVLILSATTTNVFQNLIHSLTSSGATSPYVNGISINAGTSVSIYKNKIYDLQRTGTGGTLPVNGISIAGGTTINIHNNLIGHLNAPSVSLVDAVRGISMTGTTATSTRNVYYNTIYLNASSSGTNFGSTGVYHVTSTTATTSTLDLRDNIIVNISEPNGTGKTVAYRRSSTTLTNYASTSNNNLFYAGIPGASKLIFFDGTNSDQTLSAYKSRVAPRDAASVTENPPFLSTTGSSPNFLHIDPAIGTQVESGGVSIGGITTDYDGDTRNATTPDIGADEGTFMIADLIGPVIAYTLFNNTFCTVDRTLSAVITDASGVNITSGTKPRLYFRKTTNTNTFIDNTSASNGWKYVEATNAASPFTFTTNYSLLFGGAGVIIGDSIKYFVVAQDQSPAINVGINSGTFTTPPTSVNLAAGNFPVTGVVNSYKIIEPGLSGTVTIGSSGTYTSLTEASGLFSDINSKGLSGDLLVQIVNPSLTENGTNMLNPVNYTTCSGGPYTITIKPTIQTVLSGSNSGAIIRLNGADYVVINGTIGSTSNTVCPPIMASRDMTIVNNNSGTSSAVVWMQSNGSIGATNNTVMNCNLTGNSNTTTLFGVGAGSSTISTTSLGTGNNTNSFINNSISKTQNGIYSQGASATNKNTGTVIHQNLINATSPNNVQVCGIRVGFESGISISGNKIAHLSGNSTTAGISLGILPSNTFTSFTGNEVTGAVVTKNVLDDIVRDGDGTSLGISVSAVTSAGSSANTIANNMISGVRTTIATPSNFPAGILIGGGAQGSTISYYNTISMTGSGSVSSPGFGIAIGGSNPVVDLRNNIFVNQLTSTSGKMYAIGLAYNTYTNLTSDHNDFFTTASPLAVVGGLGNSPSGDQSTLSVWQTTTGKDGASVNIVPGFISATDLHIDTGNPVNIPLDDGAVSVSITDDIDCEVRATDIGADEFVLLVCTIASGGTATISGPSSFCGSGTPVITASGYSTGAGSAYQWMSYADSNIPEESGMAVIGETNPASLNTGELLETSYFRLRVLCSSGPDTMYSNLVTITIYPDAVAFISGPSSKCENDPALTLTETGGNAITWIWNTAETTQSILADPPNTSTYTVTVSASGGCTSIASKIVIVIPAPSTPLVTPALDQSICLGAGQDLTAISTTYTIPLLAEDFNSTLPGDIVSGNLPVGWSGSSLTEGVRIWGVVNSAQSGSSLGGGNFLYCESDLYSAYQTRSQVTSPEFDASGFSSISIRFKQYYNDLNTGPASDSARIYISNDGGVIFILLEEYDTEQGTSFSNEGSITANIPVGISLTEHMVVRIVYNSDANGNDWYWAIDDFVVEGLPYPLYAWTAIPAAGAGLPAGAEIPSLSNDILTSTPTSTGTYTYTAIVMAGGCASLPATSANVTVVPTIVTNLNDNGEGSLRDVISCASDGGTITFDPDLTGQTIILTSGEILINKNLTISGPGMMDLTLSGNDASRIFSVPAAYTLHLQNLSLKHATSPSNGGAVLVEGSILLENILMENNMEDGVPKAMTLLNPAIVEFIGTVNLKY